jgi:hypothetical protein
LKGFYITATPFSESEEEEPRTENGCNGQMCVVDMVLITAILW